jgi:alpha-galactosidase
MAPLISRSAVSFLPDSDNRALFVPFDNDKWVRYNAYPFNTSITSYEVSAFYNNTSRAGLVIGSVEHDTWKTAVKSSAYGKSLNSLEVFGGVSSNKTRDVLPHGKISGTTIKSPMIFIGYFSDWRMGMETYAQANAVVSPARVWTKGTPFGWNSWGKIQGKLTYEKAVQVSDFFAKELQPNSFHNNNIVYVGLDSWWDILTDDQLKLFADRCKANGQEAGIYWAPFTQWGRDDNATVQGSDYIYKDIYLYANGQKQYLDGGTAIDPTHPAAKKRMEYFIARFKKAGFKYLKVDFLTHGAFESDSHYDPAVTTGIQAYNVGMKYLVNLIGDDMFLNQAISPAFPGNYAHSRRIACDAWGAISQTEYTMNALTYGWWLGNVYRFSDADHVVLGDQNDGENRARVTSSVITGIYILGDDFSDPGDNSGKERAKKYVTNNEINEIAKLGKSFRPLYGNMGNNASGVFFLNEKKCVYVALFNYSNQKKPYSVNVEEIGIQLNKEFICKELWSGKESKSRDTLKVEVPANDVKVFRIFKD